LVAVDSPPQRSQREDVDGQEEEGKQDRDEPDMNIDELPRPGETEEGEEPDPDDIAEMQGEKDDEE
jgi:hypothetical protein